MKKIFTFFAALTLCAGVLAQVPANVISVDLGLSVEWATMNVGATNPEEYGDYFAWGETKPKKNYSWSTYLLSFGSWSSLKKYTRPDGQTSCIWYDGGAFIGDNKTTLDPEDDAAYVNWGADWRMPTKNEIEELIGNCTWQWTNNYNNTGVKGYVVTGKKAGYTDKSIFLPASGYYEGESLEGPGTFGDYWSSSLYGYSDAAYRIYFGGSDSRGCDGVDRYNGCSVRPVYDPSTTPLSVAYIDENGVEQITNAWEIKTSDDVDALGVADSTTWYVVTGTDLQTGTIVCEGTVNLILADTAKLTADGVMMQAGVQVSGEGNSLTIYGQTEQTGQLEAKGGVGGAGIGSEPSEACYGITINGGIITAIGGESAAGIGGGNGGDASNITINRGTVIAIGGLGCSGIGGGASSSSSNILVATSLVVKADNNNPPTTVIVNDGSDLASKLADSQYVIIETSSTPTELKTIDNEEFSKFLKDGQLFIRKEGKTYTIMGLPTNH